MPLFFIPLGDDNRDRKVTPVVNYCLIGINLAVYFLLQTGPQGEKFTMAYSTVPEEIVTGQDIVTEPEPYLNPQTGREVMDPNTGQPVMKPALERTPIPVWFTLLTSMFMHGGIMHLLGNMLYLWIFGDNIEDEMGHARYLAFYLLCGLLAGFSHVFLNAWGDSARVPMLGASGAIAGVLGAYMLMHPSRGVHVLLIRVIITMPAWIVVGAWFLLQILGGLATPGGGGVAYSAHIGGFVFGFLLAPLFAHMKHPFANFLRGGRDRGSADRHWNDEDRW